MMYHCIDISRFRPLDVKILEQPIETELREFLHDVRVEMKQVTWPSREDVVSTTGVVIATVAFFGVFLAIVEWLAQHGMERLFNYFHV